MRIFFGSLTQKAPCAWQGGFDIIKLLAHTISKIPVPLDLSLFLFSLAVDLGCNNVDNDDQNDDTDDEKKPIGFQDLA